MMSWGNIHLQLGFESLSVADEIVLLYDIPKGFNFFHKVEILIMFNHKLCIEMANIVDERWLVSAVG